MQGLILKDLMNIKQQWKTYLFIIGLWGIIGIFTQETGFFGGVMMVFIVLVPVYAMGYDEKVKWDRYALTMPVSRKELVFSRYALALLCGAVTFVLSAAVTFFLTKDVAESLLTCLLTTSIGLIIAAIDLPLLFRFGVEKGRIILLAGFAMPGLLGVILVNTVLDGGIRIDDPERLLFLLPLAAVIAFPVSALISVKLYEKKEF